MTEVDRNYEAFKKLLPGLLKSCFGKYALMHDTSIVEFLDTFSDAIKFGHSKFGLGNFSVQEVTDRSVSLGFYSYALHQVSN
jgi:D-mannonate dehydratase